MVPLLCYVLTIATAFFQSNSMRYIMYGVVISIACIEELQKKKADKWAKEFPYLLLYVVIIEVITIIREIYENNTIDPGSIIQPVFLISCLIMGFNVGKKYGEAGCKDLLIFFSVIFIIAALVCVPEYVLKKSFSSISSLFCITFSKLFLSSPLGLFISKCQRLISHIRDCCRYSRLFSCFGIKQNIFSILAHFIP